MEVKILSVKLTENERNFLLSILKYEKPKYEGSLKKMLDHIEFSLKNSKTIKEGNNHAGQ